MVPVTTPSLPHPATRTPPGCTFGRMTTATRGNVGRAGHRLYPGGAAGRTGAGTGRTKGVGRVIAGDRKVIAGRYDLVREVGRGGMGAVWLGRDTVLGR